MFSLLDLRFLLCSRDLDVLRAQRIIGFFLITHKSTRSENSITWLINTYLGCKWSFDDRHLHVKEGLVTASF